MKPPTTEKYPCGSSVYIRSDTSSNPSQYQVHHKLVCGFYAIHKAGTTGEDCMTKYGRLETKYYREEDISSPFTSGSNPPAYSSNAATSSSAAGARRSDLPEYDAKMDPPEYGSAK